MNLESIGISLSRQLTTKALIRLCGSAQADLRLAFVVRIGIKQGVSWHDSYACEPGHEKMCLMSYAKNKSADQPAHPCSLIRAFVIHCLDSVISLDSIAKISRL